MAWGFVARAAADGPLDLSDLAAYRTALGPSKAGEVSRPATFRDLWDHPDDYQGHRIAVVGRTERVFHQGPVGEFPALAEVWIVDKESNPLCLVAPESDGHPAPRPGDAVSFEGTFLRRIRYRGGDVERLAPLVVGPVSPRVNRPGAIAANPAGRSPFEGIVVAVLAAAVVLALLRAHLRRPLARPIVEGPVPEFQDGARNRYDGGGEIDDPDRE